MKKIICLLLIGVICAGIGGWLSFILSRQFFVFPWEQKAMLAHLEEKYGEKFVIESTSTPGWSTGSSACGAYVYPKGKEDEQFYVEILHKGGFVDKYVLRTAEVHMLPIYEEWIKSILPEAKVAVKLSAHFWWKTNEVFYNPDETLQQFVSKANDNYYGISIEVNIMLSESVLENKDDIFEKLSKALETEPITGYEDSEYKIGVLKQDVFDNIKPYEYQYVPIISLDDKDIAKGFVAITYCYTKKVYTNDLKTPSEILEDLNSNFRKKEDT